VNRPATVEEAIEPMSIIRDITEEDLRTLQKANPEAFMHLHAIRLERVSNGQSKLLNEKEELVKSMADRMIQMQETLEKVTSKLTESENKIIELSDQHQEVSVE
jgi:hypothetical protein